jgi:pyridoxal phosphate enzyme (YggS family)
MSKSTEMPDDVSWHFIGPLQSNKAGPLVKTVGLNKLACIETVSTLKLASKLNRAAELWNEEAGEQKKLGIYIQVNTSGEETKSGVNPGSEVGELIKQISDECPLLSIDGLMTIGSPGDYSCFDTLVKCREEAAVALNKDPNELELSMGMSGDFEIAIAKGATNVRVGSTIFGDRDYSSHSTA